MIIFVDIEASSLHDGYPIEVAWCAADLSVGASYLIHPADWPHWLRWDPGAEALHGLSAEVLERDGLPPVVVAAALQRDLQPATVVVSDSPGYDRRWLRQLFDVADVQPVPVVAEEDAETLITVAASRNQIAADALEVGRRRVAQATGLRRHRALDDAAWNAVGFGLAMGVTEADVTGQVRHLLDQLIRLAHRPTRYDACPSILVSDTESKLYRNSDESDEDFAKRESAYKMTLADKPPGDG